MKAKSAPLKPKGAAPRYDNYLNNTPMNYIDGGYSVLENNS